MKTQKLKLIVPLICSFLVTPGAAMADDNTCFGGSVNYQTVEGNLVVTKQNCIVKYATIKGNVEVDNRGLNNAIFVLKDTIVRGEVKVTGGQVLIDRSQIVLSDLNIVDTQAALITHNVLLKGSILLVDNKAALIYTNVVTFGDIVCLDDIDRSEQIREFATGNLVPFGKITCFGQ